MSPSEVTAWLAAFGAAHAGIVSWRTCKAAGVSRDAFRHRVETGLLVRLAAGVYRLRDHPQTWHTLLWAAVFEVEPLQAYLSHRTAGRLQGLWAYRNCEVVEISARRGRDHATTLSRFHATSLLDPEHVTVVEGLPCTSLARTIFDLCGDPDRRPLRTEAARRAHRLQMLQVVNDAMRRRQLEVERELTVLAAIGKRGRAGTALVREIFADIGCDYVPTESELEVIFLELCRSAQLPTPEPQVWMADADGQIGRVDFLFRPRLVVEIDSSWHDGPLDKRSDNVRDDRLRALGYTVRRWRWRHLVLTPEKLVRRIRTDLQRTEPGGASGPLAPKVTAHSVLP